MRLHFKYITVRLVKVQGGGGGFKCYTCLKLNKHFSGFFRLHRYLVGFFQLILVIFVSSVGSKF